MQYQCCLDDGYDDAAADDDGHYNGDGYDDYDDYYDDAGYDHDYVDGYDHDNCHEDGYDHDDCYDEDVPVPKKHCSQTFGFGVCVQESQYTRLMVML